MAPEAYKNYTVEVLLTLRFPVRALDEGDAKATIDNLIEKSPIWQNADVLTVTVGPEIK